VTLPRARIAAIAVAVLGGLLLLLAVARVTVWATPSHTVVHVTGQAGKPLVVTTAAALALDGPSVRVSVRSADPNQDVFVGVGRAADVEAYLGNAARTEVTGVRGSSPVLTSAGSDASLPEPAGVDVWALATTGRGTAALTWPRADGSWRLVAGVDGATPPAEVVLDWDRNRGSALTPVLFALGALLLVLGLVGIRATSRGAADRRGDARVPARVGSGTTAAPPVPDAPADEVDDADVPDEDSPAPFRWERRP
jgi:hypothetical protein